MSTSSLIKRKNYWSLDIAKFFCAILIISAHFAAERGSFPTLIDYGFSVYIIGVPFFFACSGFLFFKKLDSLATKAEKKSYFISYQKRIWIMYGLWSLIYVSTRFIGWLRKGTFTLEKFLDWLHKAIVFQTYETIWFLPALAIGIAIAYFLVIKLSKKKMLAVVVIFYIIGMLGYTYKFVIDGTPIGEAFDLYIKLFVTTRNGIFNAVPFIYMGCLVSRKEITASKKGFIRYFVLAGASFVLMVAESFLLKIVFNVTGMDVCIFVAVFTYFFMMALLHIDLKENKVWLWMRKLSILLFVCQRIFLSVLPGYLPGIFEKIYANSYIGLIAVLALTISFSVILILLSKKIKFLKRMY